MCPVDAILLDIKNVLILPYAYNKFIDIMLARKVNQELIGQLTITWTILNYYNYYLQGLITMNSIFNVLWTL